MLTTTERTAACWLLTAAILAGYLIPGLSEFFAPFAFPSLLCMIVLSLVPMGRLDVEDVFSLDWKIWQIVLWQLFVLPALILAGAHLGGLHESITTLLVITASAGSLFASPTFAELLKLNKRKALHCMILSTFMMPVSYFIFFTHILHAAVSIDIVSYINRCAVFLGLPVGVFLIYMGYARALPPGLVRTIESGASRLTILALVIFGIGILEPARDLLWSDPGRFALYLVIVTCLGAGMAYLTAIVMYRQGITDALTASIVSGFRNVGLGFVLLSGFNSETAAAYVGISQIPIFLAPLAVNYLVRSSRGLDLHAQPA